MGYNISKEGKDIVGVKASLQNLDKSIILVQ